MLENHKTGVEIVGVTALVLSLIFVGIELNQSRKMNLAELHFNRMLLIQQQSLATLESEALLSAYSKRDSDWSEGLYTGVERAALIAAANAKIAYFEAEFQYLEQGFSTRTLEDLQREISSTVAVDPELRVAWKAWSDGFEDLRFQRMMIPIMEGTRDKTQAAKLESKRNSSH